MKRKSIGIVCHLLVFCSVRGHRAIECFKEENLLGGNLQFDDELNVKSDLELITSLDQKHILTSIKVCTNRANTSIRGLQVSYGKISGDGEIFDALSLNGYGELAQASSYCSNFYISDDDYLSYVGYAYNLQGVVYLELRTDNGQSQGFGEIDQDRDTLQES